MAAAALSGRIASATWVLALLLTGWCLASAVPSTEARRLLDDAAGGDLSATASVLGNQPSETGATAAVDGHAGQSLDSGISSLLGGVGGLASNLGSQLGG
ncbi:hypothetical protein ACP4OV_008325 [Aristida adscensionis]